jgi:hypothetical protein
MRNALRVERLNDANADLFSLDCTDGIQVVESGFNVASVIMLLTISAKT